jgi:hypothetical protein
MTDRAAAVAYLKPAENSFWKWVDDGRSVAWQSGDTIAFWQELLAVVQRMAPAGLPPLSAIVLLLAATRDGWNHNSSQLQAHAEQLALPGGGDPTSAIGVTLRAIGHRLGSDTANLITQLYHIAALPADLRHPLSAKVVLAEMVFEQHRAVLTPETAEQVVDELRSAADPNAFDLGRPNGNALRELIGSIDALKKGVTEIDADRLRLRLRTGLDQLIQPPEQDLGPSQRVRQLMAELSDDPELGGLSRLARTLLAAVQVPRALRHQDAVHTGGVADITNRGQLDRLLISELANDDLTLAVRVAVKEALYIQRESPPRDPPKRRVILIDCGIRLWGVPRVYATAVALALASNGDTQAELNVFRPNGKQLLPIDLLKREGLISHLESLDSRPHFGEALSAFAAEASQPGQEPESFLITQEDVLDDPEFRAALQQQDRFNCYAATVARDGTFRLWALKSNGRSLLRQAVLDLNQLLATPEKPGPRPLFPPAGNLPVILSTHPFPLLLPPGSSIRRTISRAGVKIGITRDRQMLVWTEAAWDEPLRVWRILPQGATILSDCLPTGRLDLFRVSSEGAIAVFTAFAHGIKVTMCVADLESGKVAFTQLRVRDEPPRGFAYREDTLFVIGQKSASAYCLASGEPIATVDTTGYLWGNGRIFYRQSNGFVLSLTGGELKFEQIPHVQDAGRCYFEVTNYSGILAMNQRGEIRRIKEPPNLSRQGLDVNVGFEGITSDGSGVVVRSWGPDRKCYLIGTDSSDSKWKQVPEPPHKLVNSWSQQLLATYVPHQLRNRFDAVLIDRYGNLVLHANSGKLLELKLVGTEMRLVDPGYVVHQPDTSLHWFGKTKPHAGAGYRLTVASWNNVPQLFLDSRGMLHLKSHDRSIPEVTLLLTNNGPLAGWSSDGRVYGPKYFHGSNTSHDPKHLEDLIHRFTENLR